MNLAQLSKELRDTSEKYGGIKELLASADQLDRTISKFFNDQNFESLLALNGAVANAWRCKSWSGAERKGPVAT